MTDKILLYVGRGWTEVELPESWWGSEPEEEEQPRRRPVYRVYAIRRPGPVDERAAEAVLDWLRDCVLHP